MKCSVMPESFIVIVSPYILAIYPLFPTNIQIPFPYVRPNILLEDPVDYNVQVIASLEEIRVPLSPTAVNLSSP